MRERTCAGWSDGRVPHLTNSRAVRAAWAHGGHEAGRPQHGSTGGGQCARSMQRERKSALRTPFLLLLALNELPRSTGEDDVFWRVVCRFIYLFFIILKMFCVGLVIRSCRNYSTLEEG